MVADINNPIIPVNPLFYDTIRERIIPAYSHSLDFGPLNYEAICAFVACGFFLDEDTYYKSLKVLKPACNYQFDDNGKIVNEMPYWEWFYDPKDISFKQATEEFGKLFEIICHSQLRDKNVILPISGGLDSRTLAAVIDSRQTYAYSYKFQNSFNETKYGKSISQHLKIPFKEYIICEGYLWNKINELSLINGCYSEFTHPRQMAVIDDVSKYGNLFFLGHWGDVLFDNSAIDKNISNLKLLDLLIHKVVKRSGMELGQALWDQFNLEGKFEDYFRSRIEQMLFSIKISDPNAKIRAFKSKYWAPRWTSVNINIFKSTHDISLPYYDNQMCDFICQVPEQYLSGRQIQIAYLKMKNPELAAIPWQTYNPLNLYNYKRYHKVEMLPIRGIKKINRTFNRIFTGKNIVTRNWEIQFCGNSNLINLKSWLFDKKFNSSFISKSLIGNFFQKFIEDDPVFYSHSLSMLLTLSGFFKLKNSTDNNNEKITDLINPLHES